MFTLEMLFEGANSPSLLCIMMALTHCGVVGMSVYWVIMICIQPSDGMLRVLYKEMSANQHACADSEVS